MNRLARVVGMPLAALVMVGGVLVTQISAGGGQFEPFKPADACAEREVASLADGIEGLTENLVLLGVADAACTLGVSRESLTVELAQPGERSDAEIDALREGLLAAVEQMTDDGSLPPASDLADEALDSADLNGFLKGAIGLLPDPLIDSNLKTDDVLTRALEDLDLRDLLGNLDNQDDLNKQVETAVTDAVKQALLDRLRDLL